MPTPVSIYLRLTDYNGKALATDGTATTSTNLDASNFTANNPQFMQVLSYNSSVEQTLNLGSQSTGAGAGKISLNPFSITKYLDATSPMLFQAAAAGTPYKTAEIVFVSAQNIILSKYTYKLVAVKTVSWSADGDASAMEVVSFEYGGLLMTVNKQGPDGKMNGASQAGWNKVRNIADNTLDALIK